MFELSNKRVSIIFLSYWPMIVSFASQKVCGVWTDDDDLAEQLKDVSKVTEEKSWVSPHHGDYVTAFFLSVHF